MAITDDQKKAIRAYVGSDDQDPTDPDISSRWDRLGNVHLVAEEILQQRRADMVLRDALAVDVEGDYREDFSGNLKALDETLATLAGVTGTGAAVPDPLTVSQLRNPGWDR